MGGRGQTNNRMRVHAQSGDGLGDLMKKFARSDMGKALGRSGKQLAMTALNAGVERASQALARKIQGNGLKLAGGKYRKKAVVSKQHRRR